MKPTTRRWLYGLAAILLLGAASLLVPSIRAQRVAGGLVVTNPLATSQPGGVAVSASAQPGMLLGPLLAIGRAPIVDYLWMRASKLKEEGRYFDAYQLAELIGRLQPRFAAVWGFNAWNMAYNISVTLRPPEERWRWVWNGIVLLRDQGIPQNPRNAVMYKELAWIFFHKVGEYMDEAHMYYKLQLALLMQDILGPGPNADYEGMAAAPTTWATLAADPEIAAVAKAFERDLKADISSPGVFLGLLSQTDPPRELKALLSAESTAAPRKRIENYWRARRLRDEMKLDPARIVELRKVFGPLDFRTAEANAIYWATMGTEVSQGNRLAIDIDILNTDRIYLYCLQSLFRRGKLVMSPRAREGEPPMMLPDVRFAPIMRQAFITASKKFPRQPGEGVVHTNFESAFINFMREAILRYNEAGQLKTSREWFEYLKKEYPSTEYNGGYEKFLSSQWLRVQDFTQLRDVENRLLSVLETAVQLIAYGQDQDAATYVAFARRMHQKYEKEQTNDRYRMKPFKVMYEYVVHGMGRYLPEAQYEHVLKVTGFKRPPATQPAKGETARPKSG